MINKIKDFLRGKLPKSRKRGASDQDDTLITPDTGPASPDASKQSHDISGYHTLPRSSSRLGQLMVSLKSRLQNRFTPPRQGSREKSLALSPNFGRGVEQFLSRESREPIHQFFMAFLVFTTTYGIGKTVALVLRGSPPVSTIRDHATVIQLDDDFDPRSLTKVQNINLFRTEGTGPKKTKVADVKCERAEQTSNLPIKLVNTTVLQDEVKSLASVQVRNGRALQDVRVGEQIENIAKIFKISRLELLIRNLETGACESIKSDRLRTERSSSISVMSPTASREFVRNKKMPGIENQGNKFTISKDLLQEKLRDLKSVLDDARGVPINNPDGSMSFKITELDPEGILPFLGIQDQDIITTINGKPIYSVNEIMQLFGRISSLENLQLGIKREGSESVLDYNIKK